MQLKHLGMIAISAVLAAATSVRAHDDSKAPVIAQADLKWQDTGVPGVQAAQVSGDLAKGPSRFFLRYPVGLTTPSHHHTADHYVAVVSGKITLTVDGHAHTLGPGSYFAITGKTPHTARVEGVEPAVMFIQADGAWDVVADE